MELEEVKELIEEIMDTCHVDVKGWVPEDMEVIDYVEVRGSKIPIGKLKE